MKLDLTQRKAIEYSTDLGRRVVSVSGPAGSGKTTIIREVVDRLRNQGRHVCLAAPTGKAARRIKEATGHNAVTLHRLLEYGKPVVDEDSGTPKDVTFPARCRDNPLRYTDVIVDEYAMVSEELHRNTLDALPDGGRLIAVGDVAQLPPIEPHEYQNLEGSPFERVLKYKSAVVLDTIYRQDGDSGLLHNANRVRNGKAPTQTNDFRIQISDVPILHLNKHIKEGGIDYAVLANQVITPMRSGPLGVHALNTVLQGYYGPRDTARISLPRDKWAEKYPVNVSIGEKVICNENIYDLRDFFDRFTRWDGSTPDWTSYIPCPEAFSILNGEIGIVTDILPDGSLSIQLPDRMVQMPSEYRDYVPKYDKVYSRDPRKKLDLAYAITTHKMQGSECQHVVYMMHRVMSWMLNRNNIYTAITRARDGVFLITDGGSLQSCVRYTASQKAKNKQLKGFKVGDI